MVASPQLNINFTIIIINSNNNNDNKNNCIFLTTEWYRAY